MRDFSKSVNYFAIALFILLIPLTIKGADRLTLNDIITEKSGDFLDIILVIQGKNIEYNYQDIEDRDSFIIELEDTDSSYLFSKDSSSAFIKNIIQNNKKNNLQIEIKFLSELNFKKVEIKNKGGNKKILQFRFKIEQIIDGNLNAENIDDIISLILEEDTKENSIIDSFIKKEAKKNNLKKPRQKKVIIIDAGHGGKDPGAIGYDGVYEKKITLNFAKYLAKELKKKKNLQVHLTRDRDIFLSLGQRNQIARKYNADLFISLHADSAGNKNARGLSIYTLSNKASDKEAAKLARKENKADIIAGVDLTGYNNEVKSLLIDLSQEHGKAESKNFAKILVKNLTGKIEVRTQALRFAGFAVLKNANMASVLIELGFLTNKKDAKNLQSRNYRKKFVDALSKSIDEYFKI